MFYVKINEIILIDLCIFFSKVFFNYYFFNEVRTFVVYFYNIVFFRYGF